MKKNDKLRELLDKHFKTFTLMNRKDYVSYLMDALEE